MSQSAHILMLGGARVLAVGGYDALAVRYTWASALSPQWEGLQTEGV